MEVRLDSGTIADCVNDTQAIEVDPTEKWAEALGQSLHYAAETAKSPMIYLYCEVGETQCQQHSLRLEQTIAAYELPVGVELFDESEVLASCNPETK
jgi:hypothetical protein